MLGVGQIVNPMRMPTGQSGVLRLPSGKILLNTQLVNCKAVVLAAGTVGV